MSPFIIERNAKFQLDVSENEGVTSSPPSSQTLAILSVVPWLAAGLDGASQAAASLGERRGRPGRKGAELASD